jgi:hypothetical protein
MGDMEYNYMIEIVFSDSACGGLKNAQHYGEGKYQGGCIGICAVHSDGRKLTKREIRAAQREAKENSRLTWENATPMGGNTADIYGFNLALSIGDISEEQPGAKRKQTLNQLYSVYPYNEADQLAQEMLQNAVEDLNAVRERTAAGESIRIWYSNHPDELCGLYWFLWQRNQWKAPDGQVYLIKLPEWEADENGIILRRVSWGEVGAGEWHRYLNLQQSVTPVFCHSCSTHWISLQMENAPLRVVLNGQLVSVPETIYDDFIVREIAKEEGEFQEARIVGRVLGKYQLGICDAWIALRIEEMIRAGKLEPVTDLEEDCPIYHRRLKKCIQV